MNKIFNKTTKRWIVVFLVVIALVGAMFLPTKYMVEGPGPLDEVQKYITMEENPKVKGNLYSTSVNFRPAFLFDYLFHKNYSHSILVLKSDVFGNGNQEDWEKISDFDMHEATTNATYYAAKKAKIPAKKNFIGMTVLDVQLDSDFKNKLKTGDLVTEVDGKKFKNLTGMQNYIQSQSPKKEIDLTVIRENKKMHVKGHTVKLDLNRKNGIGINLGIYNTVQTKPSVKINVDDLGGPSAGLIFTLELYQEFTGVDLTHGQKIAGTGTISAKGQVGPIGGVDKKVVGASKANAKIFFAPAGLSKGMNITDTNYYEAVQTAKRIKTKMKIVPVENFEDALNYLTRQK